MKLLKFLPILTIIVFSSCNMDPGYTAYSNVVIPFDERSVPETGQVGTPVNIMASAKMDNGCWFNIHFILTEKDDRQYEMVALADFETSGVCPTVVVSGDTTVTFTPTRPGNHVITFHMSPTVAERDTIVVGEALPDK